MRALSKWIGLCAVAVCLRPALESRAAADAVPGGAVRDVTAFGAKGDGVHDDTAAIQAALDSGGGKPVVVYFPPGRFRIAPAARGVDSDLSQGHALYVNFDNIKIAGAGRKLTTIETFVRGGEDPATHWDTTVPSGAVWRGSAFFVRSPRQNVEWTGLRITGQTPRASSSYASFEGSAPFPPRKDTGDGWGGFHSAIMWQPGGRFTEQLVHDCELDSWRAEILMFSGANYAWTGRVERNLIHDSLGSMVCIAGTLTIADNELWNGSNAIEIYHYQGDVTVERNWIHDNVKAVTGGGNVPIPDPYGTFVIRHNRFRNNQRGAVGFIGHGKNYVITDNLFTDGPGQVERYDVHFGSLYGGTPENIVIARNDFQADRRSPWCAIWLTGGLQRVTVEDNRYSQTAYAAGRGFRVQHSFRHALTPGATVTVRNSDFTGAAFQPSIGPDLPAWLASGGQMPSFDESNRYALGGYFVAGGGNTAMDAIAPVAPVMTLAGTADDRYGTVKGLRTEGIPDQQIVKFVASSARRPVQFPASGAGFRLRTARFLRTWDYANQVWIKLRFDAAAKLWQEYEVGRDRDGIAAIFPGEQDRAEHFFLQGETADTVAPVLKFYGQRVLSLAPAQERVFSEFADAPFDELLVVELGPKASVGPSKTVRLAGDQPFGSKTGGVVTFVRPRGRDALYEVSRHPY
ncbi:MAG TPA: glycosyl hydrolase family 28-related protein [Anaeromyxobacteraceae bacterium]|nr:glycosyl hydrolase family 28-related protein [Anaeromyxobacteraceae bacterium]